MGFIADIFFYFAVEMFEGLEVVESRLTGIVNLRGNVNETSELFVIDLMTEIDDMTGIGVLGEIMKTE